MYDNYHLSPNSMLPLVILKKLFEYDAVSENKGKIVRMTKQKVSRAF